MGRINVDISDELEKQLRIKTVERFGGKKGDLSKAVQQAVKKIDQPKRIDNEVAPPQLRCLYYKNA
jgi:hypothetical protein